MDRETTPCTQCSTPTPMLGTKLCDPCWEKDRHGVFDLEARIERLEWVLMEIVKGGNLWSSCVPPHVVDPIRRLIGKQIDAHARHLREFNRRILDKGPKQ